MRIYLDVCCLNRPFDDQAQDRVRLETEAIKSILLRIGTRQWIGVSSEVVLLEISRMVESERQLDVGLLASQMPEFVTVDEPTKQRAQDLEKLGFHAVDALHIACAEKSRVDVLLTTDDHMLKKYKQYARRMGVLVANPLTWIEGVVRL